MTLLDDKTRGRMRASIRICDCIRRYGFGQLELETSGWTVERLCFRLRSLNLLTRTTQVLVDMHRHLQTGEIDAQPQV